MSDYLLGRSFSNKNSNLLFNLRYESVNKFRGNIQSSDHQPPCIICGKCEDNQEHALICNVLKSHNPREHKESVENVIYADLFDNTIKQLRVTEAFSIIIKTR